MKFLVAFACLKLVHSSCLKDNSPPAPKNGKIVFDSAVDPANEDSKAQLMCRGGYRPDTSLQIACKNGIWTGELGQCVAQGCRKEYLVKLYGPQGKLVYEPQMAAKRVLSPEAAWKQRITSSVISAPGLADRVESALSARLRKEYLEKLYGAQGKLIYEPEKAGADVAHLTRATAGCEDGCEPRSSLETENNFLCHFGTWVGRPGGECVERKVELSLDISKEAVDILVEYKKNGEPDDMYVHLEDAPTLLNCDYENHTNYQCNFTIYNLTESRYDIRIVPVLSSQTNQIAPVYVVEHLAFTVNSARLYVNQPNYNVLRYSSGVYDVSKGTPRWKMLAHDAPEHVCPQRLALSEYYAVGKTGRQRDNVLLMDEQIEDYKAMGYGESRGLMGFCAPAAGECGATKQLYTAKAGISIGGGNTKLCTNYIINEPSWAADTWDPIPCFVWN